MPNWITYIDDLEFECTYDPGEPETYDHPGASISVKYGLHLKTRMVILLQ